MAYQLYQLFPRDIARHIHFSINPTPAQRRAGDLAAHKKESCLYLETIFWLGELYRTDPDPDYEDLSFIAWWWEEFSHVAYGVGLFQQYIAQCAVRDAAHAEAEAHAEIPSRALSHLQRIRAAHQTNPGFSEIVISLYVTEIRGAAVKLASLSQQRIRAERELAQVRDFPWWGRRRRRQRREEVEELMWEWEEEVESLLDGRLEKLNSVRCPSVQECGIWL
jgi:hypothetical protein